MLSGLFESCLALKIKHSQEAQTLVYRIHCGIKTPKAKMEFATLERKLCNVEEEIVTFVAKICVELTVSPIDMSKAKCEDKSIALCGWCFKSQVEQDTS